jgi:hypothetical protein
MRARGLLLVFSDFYDEEDRTIAGSLRAAEWGDVSMFHDEPRFSSSRIGAIWRSRTPKRDARRERRARGGLSGRRQRSSSAGGARGSEASTIRCSSPIRRPISRSGRFCSAPAVVS